LVRHYFIDCGIQLLHNGRLIAADTPENIKKLMKDSIVEVTTPEARRAARVLRKIFPAEKVGLFGTNVHVFVRDADAAFRDIENQLKADGCVLEEMQVIEPSLEDVFVSVVGRKDDQNEQ
jgi:ABC-2 type transport system ATP-binding protein